MIKLNPPILGTVFNSEWANWLNRLFEKQKTFIQYTDNPEVSASTTTHKVPVIINGNTYYILLSDS